MLLTIFGIPGAGKTFVGRVLQEEFGFTFHDADHDLPDDMRRALEQKQPVTDAMRDEFFKRITATTTRLRHEHTNLAIAQTFLKEKYRRRFLDTFPDAKFILVRSDPSLIETRFAQRRSYLIDKDDALQMAARFDPPQIEHRVVENLYGRTEVIAQLRAVLDDLTLPT